MKKKFLIMLLSFSISIVKGQSLAINNDGSVANNSAILDVKSTTKGLLIPRMSKVQRTAITSPSTGLLIYQNAPDSTGFYYYDGASWQWLSTANDNNNNWKLTGNSGTQPYLNFLGTSDLSNLTIKTNNADRVSVTTEAEVGIGTQLPYYTLDIITGTANINNCEQNGIRVRTAQSSTGACEAGLFMGYTDLNTGSNEGIIRNYGQQANGVKTLAFGVGPVLTMMRLTSDGLAGIGSGTLQPQYGLDVTLGIAAVSPPCGRNGLRLNPVGNNACESGVFLGYDSIGNYNSTSLWNFSADNSGTNSFIRFGFGTNFSQAPATGEAMRILPPGKGVGINQINPVAMLHISNYTGSGVLPGVMVTNPTLPPNSNGFYSGLKLTGPNYHEGYIWNYQNAPTIFGTNDLERMRISENGNIGINTTNPIARLHVADSCVVFSANGSPIYPASPSPINGPGRRMLWYADKAAFRAGYVDGVQWDSDSIGVYSFAVGYNTKAKDYSTALGTDTKASNGSLSTGAYSTASGLYSFATGIVATAGGEASISTGYQTRALGNYSVAAGSYTTASNTYAVAMGNQSSASGEAAFSMGSNCAAQGPQSAAFGKTMFTRAAHSFVVGSYNESSDFPDPQNPAATDRIFQIGNGDNSTRSNAITILRNGNMGIGATTPGFPLNFANNLGDKISLWGNSGNHYGFGIQGGLLQMHSAGSGDDIAFGYGSSASFTEGMRIKGNGKLGIGTSNPFNQTEIVGAASATPVTLTIGNRGGFGPAAMEFVSDYGLGSQWRPGYIRSNDIGGFTGVLEFYTNIPSTLYTSIKGLEVRNGVTYTATGTVSSWSDNRLKKDITQFTKGLEIISKINPVQFYYNEKAPFKSNDLQIGVLAQELEKIAPYMVDKINTKDFTDLRSVNNQAYTFLLINAVKEQQKQIDELKQQVQLLLKNK